MAAACTLAVVSACSEKAPEISLDTSIAPQTRYVVGHDLDLSKGRLKVNGTSLVPLNDGKVTVEGYDKNKLGEQTLTISYRGAEVELKIEVVPRIEPASKYVYFVGDELADANPMFIITRDDGSTIQVNAPYTGFTADVDTDEPAETVEVSATYINGSDNFTGTFDVEVCTPVYTFTPPRTTEYGSHETELNTVGASLTIKNEAGSAQRVVPLNQLEFKGFDPSKVTASNSSATQKVEVLYRGEVINSFNVDIKYSNISHFIDFAAECPEFEEWVPPEDWEGMGDEGEPQLYMPDGVTAEMGEEALQLLSDYAGMKTSDREYISQNVLEAVARVGVIYGYNTWYTAFYSDPVLNKAVLMDNTGEPIFLFTISAEDSTTGEAVTVTAEDYLAAAKKLLNEDDSDETVNKLEGISEILCLDILSDKLGETNIYDETSASPMASIFDWYVKDHAYLLDLGYAMQYAVDAYDLLKDFQSPASHSGWLTDDMLAKLNDNAATITEAYDKLNDITQRLENLFMKDEDGSITNGAFPYIYRAVNNFRADNAFYEIVYRYYVNGLLALDMDAEDYDEKAAPYISALGNLTMQYIPDPINNLAPIYQDAYTIQLMLGASIEGLEEGSTENLLIESVSFMFAYNEAVKYTEDFFNEYINKENESESDVVYLALYYYLGDALSGMYEELYSGDYGYLYLMDAASFDDGVWGVWLKYCDIWYANLENDALFEDTTAAGEEFRGKIEEMFKAFSELSPVQQNYFLNSLNYLYPVASIPEFSLTLNEDGSYGSEFAEFVYRYYIDKLGMEESDKDTAYTVFYYMMAATESYARGDIGNFYENTNRAKAAYDGTWAGKCTKETFDAALGGIYNKNLAIFETFDKAEDEEGKTEYTYDSTALTEADKKVLEDINRAISNANYCSAYSLYLGSDLELTFLAAYEQLRELTSNLTPGSDVELAYNNMPYSNSGETLASLVYTLDYNYRITIDNLDIIIETYEGEEFEGMRTFFADYAEYFYTATTIYGIMNEAAITPVFSYGNEFDVEATGDLTMLKLTPEYISGMLSAYASLTDDERVAITQLDELTLFIYGMSGIEYSDITEEGESQLATLADQLLAINAYYQIYLLYPDTEFTEEPEEEGGEAEVITIADYIVAQFELFNKKHDALGNTLKAEFDSYFEPLMSMLKEKCDEIAADAENGTQTDAQA